jgi:hypothetical protein
MKPDICKSADSRVEVADIFRRHIGDYLDKYKMPPEHYKVVYDILNWVRLDCGNSKCMKYRVLAGNKE